jgi:hypothetical protein
MLKLIFAAGFYLEKVLIDIMAGVEVAVGRPHHVKKVSSFSIESRFLSLSSAYCERIKRRRSPPKASL